jgi:hypothetical protein
VDYASQSRSTLKNPGPKSGAPMCMHVGRNCISIRCLQHDGWTDGRCLATTMRSMEPLNAPPETKGYALEPTPLLVCVPTCKRRNEIYAPLDSKHSPPDSASLVIQSRRINVAKGAHFPTAQPWNLQHQGM